MKYILSSILILLLNVSSIFSQNIPKAIDGKLDLRDWDFSEKGIISLEGKWEFYWNRFLKSDSIESTVPDALLSVPGNWNGTKIGEQAISGFGYATYRLTFSIHPKNQYLALKALDLASAFKVWVNGTLVLENGKIGKTKEEMLPQYHPKIALLTNLKEENEICVEISNFHHVKGGFWESFRIGTMGDIQSYRESKYGFDLFLTGSLLIMGIYHIGLFTLRRKDKSSLLLGVFCFDLVIRLLVTGERLLLTTFSNVPWEIGLKIEYLTFYLASPIFASFLFYLYREEFSKWFIYISYVVCSLLAFVVIATPAIIYTQTIIFYQLFVVITCIYSIYAMILSSIRLKEGAAVALLGFILFFITIVNDILYANLVINTYYLAPFGLFLFIFSQAFILSLRFSKAFSSVEKLSEDLSHTNKSYSRFVPREFLSFLEKSNIIDVRLGDQIQKNMTILFSDIRSFTEISENMTPEENFNFINSYLKIMSPLIRKYKGFIDKYIGDAIMALFPVSARDAILTAIEMQKSLSTSKLSDSHHLYTVKVGIGIHTGSLMLGTVGDEERMEGTVISDAVNLASRLEGLTKQYAVSIIISKQSLESIEDLEGIHYRFLGNVKVKGKKELSEIYEVFSADEPSVLEKKKATKARFEKAIGLFLENSYLEAETIFHAILQINPDDKPAEYYLRLCQKAPTI